MLFFNVEEFIVVELIVDFGINILWYFIVGLEIGYQVSDFFNDCIFGKIQFDIFVFEGFVVQGLDGIGKMNYFVDCFMQDWICELFDVV